MSVLLHRFFYALIDSTLSNGAMDAMATNEETRLNSVVDTVVDGVITIDDRGIIHSFNAAATRIFGYMADEVIGTDAAILLPASSKDQHDGYLVSMESGIKENVSIAHEAVGQRKDGSLFSMGFGVSAFSHGDRKWFTGIVHDLTEQKPAEEQAMQSERLAAIGQMITVVTHESRNALQLSQANLEMLVDELEELQKSNSALTSRIAEALSFTERIQMAQNRLQRLFNELRDFAAPIRLDHEIYNLGSLVGLVLNELSSLLTDRQIRLCQQANGVNLRCAVDPFRMHQVFRNILENSIAACPDPVKLTVAWSPSHLNGTPALQVTLRDNGPGLTAEQKQKCFEPFFTTRKGGTGLGLAITRRIVEAHGGHIAAQGDGGSGAEFVISLPRETASI
ncbi:MAG: PAS domain S-box protein [Planctomycetales bacterium]|nr:PAS domain S-box protein [Planctomycetales bacterium]